MNKIKPAIPERWKNLTDLAPAGPVMKTCPFCAEHDLQPEARICKHCGRDITQTGNFLTHKITASGAAGVVCVVLGFVFWPFWILAGVFLIVHAVKRN